MKMYPSHVTLSQECQTVCCIECEEAAVRGPDHSTLIFEAYLVLDLLAIWGVLKSKDDVQAHDWTASEGPRWCRPDTAAPDLACAHMMTVLISRAKTGDMHCDRLDRQIAKLKQSCMRQQRRQNATSAAGAVCALMSSVCLCCHCLERDTLAVLKQVHDGNVSLLVARCKNVKVNHRRSAMSRAASQSLVDRDGLAKPSDPLLIVNELLEIPITMHCGHCWKAVQVSPTRRNLIFSGG